MEEVENKRRKENINNTKSVYKLSLIKEDSQVSDLTEE